MSFLAHVTYVGHISILIRVVVKENKEINATCLLGSYIKGTPFKDRWTLECCGFESRRRRDSLTIFTPCRPERILVKNTVGRKLSSNVTKLNCITIHVE